MDAEKNVVEAARVEEWRAIPGVDGYEVSSIGRVRSVARRVNRIGGGTYPVRGRTMRTHVGKIYGNRSPRMRVTLSVNGKTKCFRVSVLVARAFLGDPMPGHEINHKDANSLNDRAENLEYVTRARNLAHAFEHGLVKPPLGRRFPKGANAWTTDGVAYRNQKRQHPALRAAWEAKGGA